MKRFLSIFVLLLITVAVSAQDIYMVKLKVWKKETFSLNLKNERNAVVFEMPTSKEFYNSIKVGQKIQESPVYSSAFSIIPRFFEELVVEVSGKRIQKPKDNPKK